MKRRLVAYRIITIGSLQAVLLILSVAYGMAKSVTIARTRAAASRPASSSLVVARSRTTRKKTSATKLGLSRRLSAKKGPSFGDPTNGDESSGEDPVVRQAAVDSLDGLLASMIAVDPSSGRILTIVNQNLAFAGGYQPCSTFKPAVALAALQEGVISADRTRLQLGKRWYMTLEESLAHSNNVYFAKLGALMGLETMRKYAAMFGFAEHAGWGIEKEQPGSFPEVPPPASVGGVGKVASFGEGISQTLFQEVSFMSALSNGGTLYYLQYPKTPEELENFQPRIKRQLEIGPWLDPVREGMLGAVEFGTARRAHQPDFPILGKTGTCSQNGMKLGWFSGYSGGHSGLAVAVLQRTPQPMGGGPHAAQIAGRFFRKLADENYVVGSAEKKPATASLPAAVQMFR
jgi:penicillin-binding protein 2